MSANIFDKKTKTKKKQKTSRHNLKKKIPHFNIHFVGYTWQESDFNGACPNIAIQIFKGTLVQYLGTKINASGFILLNIFR